MPWLLFTIPILSTLVGGVLALRLRHHLTLLMSVGAGILLGAAFLDLLPEAIAAGASIEVSPADVLGMTLLAFLAFLALDMGADRMAERMTAGVPMGAVARRLGVGMLIFHSFRDGMAIGAAYAASHRAGIAVMLGIAAHDLGDGLNTVVLTRGRGERPAPGTYGFLVADALAPFLGGVLTLWWTLSARGAVVLLALAAGFFLQMATGEFLPEVLRAEGWQRRMVLPAVVVGVALIYGANALIGAYP